MASIAKLVVTLGANVAGFETDMKRATRNQRRRMKELEQSAAAVGRGIGIAFGAASAAMAVATKSAMEFEKAMAEVATLGVDNIDQLGDSVKQLSVQFGQAPVAEAKALYQIISAGASDAATQIEQLTVANKLAVGGITDVAIAADGLTTVINAYAADGLEAERVSDVLFATMRGGKTTIEELAGSIGNVATIAAQTGVSFEEVGAAVATLTKSGISTSQSMDALRGVLSAVLKQSDQSVKMAQELGIEFNATALEAKGLYQFLRDIAGTGATAEQLSKLFGRVEGLNAVMALASNNGAEFTRQLDAMASATGETDKAVAKMAESTAFKMDQVKQAFQVARIEMGERFLGVVAMVATGFIGDADDMVAVAGRLGDAFAALAAWAVKLWGYLQSLAAVIAGLVSVVVNSFQAIFAPVAAATEALYRASDAISKGDLKGAWEALSKTVENSGKIFTDAVDDVKFALQDLTGANVYYEKAQKIANDMMRKGAKAMDGIGKAAKAAGPNLEAGAQAMEGISKASSEFEKTGKSAAMAAKDLADATAEMEEAADDAFDTLGQMVDELDAWDEEQRKVKQSGEALLATLYPMEAATRKFHQELQVLRDYAEQAGWSAEQLADAEVRLAESFREATGGMVDQKKEMDLLASAMDEGARIIERAFQGMFESLISDAEFSFDSIFEAFQSLIARMVHAAITQPIVVQIQQAFGQGGGGLGSINWGQIGQTIGQGLVNLAPMAGMLFADTVWGQAGSALGGLAGQAIVKALEGTWLALGSIGGPILMGITSILGSMLGDFLGGVFARDPEVWFRGPGTPDFVRPEEETLFGMLDVRLRGGTGPQEDPNSFGGQALAAIRQFDESLSRFLTDDQIGRITEAMQNWRVHLKNEAVTIENILESRFGVILTAFEQDIRDFVMLGDGLEQQVDRLAAALAVDDLIAANADIFGGRSRNDVLDVISLFQTATGTMVDAFNAFVDVFNQVGSAYAVLQGYAQSDLAGDYQTLLNASQLTQGDALMASYEALGEAIRSFSGAPAELSQIGQMVMSVRQQELQLLAQIDGIAKGMAARMQSLRDYINGILFPAQEMTAEQAFREAQKMLDAVRAATSPEEIARIGEQFDSFVRSLAPEQIQALGTDWQWLVDAFDQAQAGALETMRQSVMENADAMQDMISTFLTEIGEPLDIIANYMGEDASIEQATIISDGINQTMVENNEDMRRIMADGLQDINRSVGGIGPVADLAIRQGFAGANVTVNVQVDEALVNG